VRRHLDGADRFFEHADFLRGSGRTDPTTIGWAITALFYSALHELRAYIQARHNREIATHEDMRDLPSTYPELRKTSTDYEELKQQSQGARYYMKEFTWDDFARLRSTVTRIKSCWRGKTEKELEPPPSGELGPA